jgi:hypothetical protein
MIKVYYTEDHFVSALGEDGRYDFVTLNREDIEDGVKIRVKAGSTLPMDKTRLQSVAINLAKLGKISLLSLYEFLDIPNPGKHVERVLKEQIDPVSIVEDIRNDEQDANAVEDYELIEAGAEAEPRDDVSARHIKTHQKQLISNDFKMLSTEAQEMIRIHIQAEIEKLKAINGLTDEDINPVAPEEPNPGINASVSIPEAMQQPNQMTPPPVAPMPAPMPSPMM